MTYVDGFLIPVRKSKVNAYRKMARQGADLWMKHGALAYRECMADDLMGFDQEGNPRPSLFPKLAGAKKGETVFFSYIEYKSKAHRDRVNRAVMGDPSMAQHANFDMPFDMERMAYAGFKPLVEAATRKGGQGQARRAGKRAAQRPRQRGHGTTTTSARPRAQSAKRTPRRPRPGRQTEQPSPMAT